MPLRRYKVLQPPCRLCGDGFECLQSASEPLHTECPTCGLPVAPALPDAVHTPHLLKPLSRSDAKAAGFTILRRTADGSFEKQ